LIKLLIVTGRRRRRRHHHHHQYSYYAIDVTGVPHISITEDYLWIVIVRSAMQTAIN
jgi:hypothetical protein